MLFPLVGNTSLEFMVLAENVHNNKVKFTIAVQLFGLHSRKCKENMQGKYVEKYGLSELVRNTFLPGIHFFYEGKVIEKPLPAPLRCTCGPQNPLKT